MPDYTTTGNAANLVVLAASLVYAGVVLVDSPVLDGGWKEDGFCISQRDVDYWSSFDTCLYVDVFFSGVLMLMWLNWRHKPGMARASELVPMVILSTVGHGAAHGHMALNLRADTGSNSTDVGNDESSSSSENELATAAMWQIAAFICLFWFPLLKASLHKVNSGVVALLAVVVTTIHGMMPKQFSFGYVQTVVSIAFHTSQLLLSSNEKNCREYATLAVTASIPVFTAWNEALLCTAYFKSAGGHMLYDASIILSFIAYYSDAYYFNTGLSTPQIDEKKKK